ncbi:hypothetical protein AVEN_230882-1 [Araneus ventricosus]|uniref:Uncharacterized protein n=1 Tax=Araneus ventricosus TaxID=182803 RepID=A0A4Y2A2E0_ARAVE|nr:hypothetical protein AVEN_230882-1 [Araneus ventricosus]
MLIPPGSTPSSPTGSGAQKFGAWGVYSCVILIIKSWFKVMRFVPSSFCFTSQQDNMGFVPNSSRLTSQQDIMRSVPNSSRLTSQQDINLTNQPIFIKHLSFCNQNLFTSENS